MTTLRNISEIQKIISLLEKNELVEKKTVQELSEKLNILIEQSSSKASNNGITKFLEAILNRIPDPIFIKDENHTWVFLNDSACELFGFERHKLIGKTDYDIFLEEEADVYWKVDNMVFKSGEEIRNEEYQTHPITGKKRIIDTKKTLYTDELGDKYIVGIIRDVTKQKIAQEKMEEAVKSKEKIFSIIAHDLRDPFNALLGFSSLLRKRYDKLSEEKKVEFIKNIDDIANNTFVFVENLLDWTATQSGKISYNPINVSVKEILNNILQLLSETAKRKNIFITDNISNDIDIVYADKNMVSTVLRNLISNAIKFTENHGEIVLNSEKSDENMICFCVADNGVGIPKDIGSRLFSEEKTFSKPGTHGEKGIGLGLILCKEFVERHGGKLWYEPNGNKGTKFCFTLPAEKL